MHVTSHADKLSEKRYATVILRLMIDRRDGLVSGEVVDTDGELCGRFAGWRELIRVVCDYVEGRQGDATLDSP